MLAITEGTQAAKIPKILWNWEQTNYQAEWHEPIFELMARYVPKGSRILEVGAGGSHTLGALAGRLHCSGHGLEPDLQGIEKTKELGRNEGAIVEMIRGDGFNLPYRDGEFDVVYSLGLIEHFTPNQTADLIAEHVRVCKADGIVIIAVPNYLNFPHTFRKFILGRNYEYYPERSYTPKQLERMLVAARLRIKARDGVLPLWGLAMYSGAWRITAVLDRIGVASQLNHLKSSKLRAALGYMTYIIANKY